MGTKSLVRQGDVLIVSVDTLPRGDQKRRNDLVLAHGESGHQHVVALEDQGRCELLEVGSDLFLRVGGGADPVFIVHAEHARVAVVPGLHRIQRQREYAPEAILPVVD